MNRKIAWLLVLVMIITLLSPVLPVLQAHASGAVASGTCGDNLTWTPGENGLCTICGEVITLDSIAWEDLTYRDIFITNNKAYLDGFNCKTFSPYVQNTGTNTVVSDAYYTGPYSLAAFGATSQQIKSVDKMPAGDYFIASKVYCARYAAGELGVCLFSTTIGVTDVTDGFVTASGILSSQKEGRIFIGSIHSADLDGYVDDTVVVNMSIFDTAPTEAELTELYEQYVELEKAIPREEVPYTEQECLDAFVECMNEKAAVIGMTNSSFVGPIGTDNITTASDLLRLMVYAYINYPELNNIWSHSSYTVTVSGENAREQTVESTVIKAALEDYYHILGGKTGTLSKFNARNLAVILEIPDSDDKLAVVALYADGLDTDENNRFEAVRQIADAALAGDTDADVCCAGAIACLIPADGADMDALQILYEKDADTQRVPASITKVLAAICAMDMITDMEHMVTYSDFDTDIGNYYKGDFLPGDSLTFRDALYAMLLPSSNVTARMVGREAGKALLNGTHTHTYENGICTVCGGSVADNPSFTHAVPTSDGVQNAIKRAYQFTDVEWTPVENMPGIVKIADGIFTYQEFVKGVTYKGIPYSSNLSTDLYVGLTVSLETFITAVQDGNSVLYTKNMYSDSYKKAATYYGTVCSKFAMYVLNIPGAYHTSYMPDIDGMEIIASPGKYTLEQVELGDVILKPGKHAAICTGLLYNSDGTVAYIEISEAVAPVCRRLWWSSEEFFDHFGEYGQYRYDYIDSVPYEKSDYVDLEGESGAIEEFDCALMPAGGNKYITPVSSSEKGYVDILKSGYKKAVVLRNGTVIDEIELSDSVSQIAFDRSVPGNIQIYLVDEDGEKTESVYVCVAKCSVSVPDSSDLANGTIEIEYNGTSGKPLYAEIGTQKFFSLEEGTDSASIRFKFSHGKEYQIRVAYETEYGIYLSKWVSFTVPEEDPLAGHLQPLPDHVCTGLNIWPLLEHENEYYTSSGWGLTSRQTVHSVTFPVMAGERIYASCFKGAGENGFSGNATRITFFNNDKVLVAMDRESVYAEYMANGYLTVPEGATAVCIPMADDSDEWEIFLLDRTHTYEAVVTAPTCTEQGYTTYTCPCGDTYVADFVDATGHSMGNWYTVTEATCTADGLEQRDCANCDHSETRAIAAPGHIYEAVVTPPTCTEQGYTTYTCACGDTYVSNYVDALGHTHVETERVAATCTADGYVVYTCACGDTYTEVLPAPGHTYSAVVTAPTCTEQGYTTYTCHCGDTYVSDYVAASGHSLGNWYTVTEATCTADGLEQRDCANCDHSETRAIAATGHTYEAVVTPPTCTEQGYTTYTCHCGDTYDADFVDALGHTHVETERVAATCTADGYVVYTCACGDTYTEVLPASGHEYADGSCEHCGEPDPDAVLMGDVNGDGTINHIDAMLIAQHYVGIEVDLNLSAADVNGDGIVNHLDAMLIAQFYVGIIDKFN